MTRWGASIEAEAAEWAREGLVSREQAAAIVARYAGRERARRRDAFVRVLATVGAAGIGLGVILFFAANWDGIPRLARLVLLAGSIVGLYAGGDRLRAARPRVGEALLLLGCLLFGASLFLVGQMFNVAAHDPLAFLLWSAAAAAGAVLLRSQPFAALAALAFAGWIAFELVDAHHGEAIAVALPIYAAALYAGGTRFRVPVLRALGAPALLALVFPFTIGGAAGEIADASAGGVGAVLVGGLAVVAVALAAALALDRRRETARWEALGCCAVVALAAGATFVDVGPLLPNLVLVALALGTVALGYAADEPWLVNVGLVAIVVEAAIRFLDFFARIMPRSLAFLAGGALVLALAFVLERHRARLGGAG
jgi:uncharacterized membrane protein